MKCLDVKFKRRKIISWKIIFHQLLCFQLNVRSIFLNLVLVCAQEIQRIMDKLISQNPPFSLLEISFSTEEGEYQKSVFSANDTIEKLENREERQIGYLPESENLLTIREENNDLEQPPSESRLLLAAGAGTVAFEFQIDFFFGLDLHVHPPMKTKVNK